VMEEVGVEIGAMRYFDSQSWPFPASLMMGFVAQARTYTIVVDDHELEAARWVTREELQKKEGFFVPPTGALAGLMIDAFARGELHAPGTQD
jgi:NAD+ diphosphatase